MKTATLVDQLRGATKLAVTATRSVTDLVEKMHHTIGGGPDLLGRPFEGVTKAFTAPTYGAVRGITQVVGTGLDAALDRLSPLVDRAGAQRGPLLAALNGVLGDYLAETDNPLAIDMCLCGPRGRLELTPGALAEAFPEGARLLLLVHGSSMDEEAFRGRTCDYGARLAQEAGFLPIYLRYNSGLHISDNGRLFADLLERLFSCWPRDVEQLSVVAHSMGGLVTRSACAYAEQAQHRWRSQLSRFVTLGTPHHGALLERGGNVFETLLGANHYSAPLAALGRLRSAGVTDLRYGNVLEADWHGADRFAMRGDTRTPLALPAGVECFAIAASTSRQPARRLRGDGLVSIPSALGKHRARAHRLAYPPGHTWIAMDATHFDLLGREDIYETLRGWLVPRRPS